MLERERFVMGKNVLWYWIILCCALDSALPYIHMHMVCVNALTASFKFKYVGYFYVILFITNERSTASSRLTIFRLSGSQRKLQCKFFCISIRSVKAGF